MCSATFLLCRRHNANDGINRPAGRPTDRRGGNQYNYETVSRESSSSSSSSSRNCYGVSSFLAAAIVRREGGRGRDAECHIETPISGGTHYVSASLPPSSLPQILRVCVNIAPHAEIISLQ